MKLNIFRHKLMVNFPEIYEFMDLNKTNQRKMRDLVINDLKTNHNIFLIGNELYIYEEINIMIRAHTWYMINNKTEYVLYRLLL